MQVSVHRSLTSSDIHAAGAFFTTYEGVKSLLAKFNPNINGSSSLIPQPFIHSAASATAELVSCFILTPAEVLKQNAQVVRRPTGASSKPSTALQSSVTMQALKKFQRPSQLWRGYGALAARNLPFTALQFPAFEYLKASIKKYRERTGSFTGGLMETALTTSISAGSAGAVAAVITTPVDVVKTRIMLSAAGVGSEHHAKAEVKRARNEGQSLEKLTSKSGSGKKDGLTVAREIVRDGGMKGLFRGGLLRAAWTSIGSGLYLGVYESGRVFLGSRHHDAKK
jgi:solute carrier family 25 S-adenosylmethionine transporter 26